MIKKFKTEFQARKAYEEMLKIYSQRYEIEKFKGFFTANTAGDSTVKCELVGDTLSVVVALQNGWDEAVVDSEEEFDVVIKAKENFKEAVMTGSNWG